MDSDSYATEGVLGSATRRRFSGTQGTLVTVWSCLGQLSQEARYCVSIAYPHHKRCLRSSGPYPFFTHTPPSPGRAYTRIAYHLGGRASLFRVTQSGPRALHRLEPSSGPARDRCDRPTPGPAQAIRWPRQAAAAGGGGGGVGLGAGSRLEPGHRGRWSYALKPSGGGAMR